MQFKGLKIAGFKSFADPVDVAVEEGLTGIVGPNGCGKSNLLEAMRWVMGASSARAMRGGEMDDLIFSGAANRPAREHAEVALVLDNSSRTAPADLNDSDELEVRRKLRRGVGSTYKINGRTVRAKDVQLLFADASTGANSPALVRQGQISELIASKPQNRRRILEEAAGIAGLNTRRHEAELKLNGAEANLERLDEIIGEVEKQLNSLKRQAGKARRYRALSTEIQGLEAKLMAAKWRAAKQARMDAESELADAKRAIEDGVAAEARTATAEAEARVKITPLRNAESEAAGRLGVLKLDLAKLDGERKAAREAVDRLNADLTRIVEDLAREHSLREEADDKAARAAEDLALLPTDDPQARETAERDARAQLEATSSRLKDAESALDAKLQIIAAADANANAARDILDREETRLERLTIDLARAEQDRDALGDMAALKDALADAQAAADAAEADMIDAQTAAEAANTELERARSAQEAAAAPVDAMRADVRALEAEIAGLDRLLRKADGPARPPIMDEIRADKDIARALAAALGDDLDAPTDIDAPLHWTMRSSDATAKLPAGAQSLSDMVEAPSALLPRLKQCGLIDREDGARLQPDLSQGQRLVSREGDLWRWDGFVRTAEAPTPAAEKLEQRARRETCAASLSTARSDLARLSETADAAKAAFEAAEASASTTTSAAPEAARAAAKARESLLRAEQAVERLTLKTQSVTETIARLGSDRQTAEAAVTGARKALTSGPDDADKAAVDTARTEVQSAREAERAAHNAHSDLVRDQDRAVNRRRALEREQADWTARAESAAARLEALAAQRTSARAQLDAAEAAPEALEARAETLAKTVAEAEQARQLAADTLSSAETTLRETESAARQVRDTNSAARETLARAEAREEAAMRRETEIENNARAAFDRDLEALETFATAALHADKEIAEIEVSDDLHAQETRLALLKREREALGGVNLEADEQLAETSARLELQLSERNDLTGAIEKLREGVEALNKEGRARLLEAFEGVAAHFRSLFEALFEGGEAELRLTDSDDPLQAGLEIFACPPGKRLSTLSLMSGGEQALTAAALIFAVFLSRPAPLCVLDEVDAPLDDANVDRFCRLLDEMRRRTQTRFIVITHNPVTMSRMDRLFGVTMQERGVSRLVSVDLQSAERLIAAE